MINFPTIDEKVERRLERRLNLTQYILIALLVVVIFVPIFFTWWIDQRTPFIKALEIENPRIIGDSALCPGDLILIEYDFHARGAGVLVRDRTLWRINPPPPKTLVFSVSRRFILTEAIDQHLVEGWHIPTEYVNPENDSTEPLPPGEYALFMAISSPSRSTAISINSVHFTVKDCT